jgi:GrpB-like predicted nucleotidyltransferase (UPF0157 family)
MPEADAPIGLVDYDPRWPSLFDDESASLHRVLLPWLAGPIEHIGSTAVPGLAAKPIIDMMAPVRTLEESRDAIPAVRTLDYLHAPYHADVEHWFCKPRPSFRTHHLHLVPYQSPLWIACIVFRDQLRNDSRVAAQYLELKRSLAASFEHDREAYTEGKSKFVTRIVKEALHS